MLGSLIFVPRSQRRCSGGGGFQKGSDRGRREKASQERTIFMTQKSKECDLLERITGCCVWIQYLCGRQLL